MSHLKRSLVVSRQPGCGRARDTVEVITEERVERYRRVLGLGPAAGVDDVRRCYRREMRRWHPDVVGGDAERAKLINEARDYFTKHPAAIPVKPAAKARTPQPRTPQPPRRTPPAPAATTRVAPDSVAEPPHRTQAPPMPRRPSPAYPTSSRASAVPQPVAARQVAVVPELQDVVWRVVGGAIKVLYYLVIAYVVLFIFALVGYLLTAVLPWFLKVVVPMAWP